MSVSTLLSLHAEANRTTARMLEQPEETRVLNEPLIRAAFDAMFHLEGRITDARATGLEEIGAKLRIAIGYAIEADGPDLDPNWLMVRSAFQDIQGLVGGARTIDTMLSVAVGLPVA